MVKCSVLWCENDSLKHQNVFFHQLSPHIAKSTYICAPTRCKEALFACSEHYKADDFIEDQDGNMQLKPDSVPVFQYCSICLQTNIKLVDMTNNLNNIYQDIVTVNFNIEDVCLNNSLCIQCAHRLRNFHSFKEKCNLASSILIRFFEKKQINKRTLSMLNRERSKLKSTLSIKKYDPNYFDMELIEDITIKIDEEFDIKYELRNDFDDTKSETSDVEPTLKEEFLKNDQCINESELNIECPNSKCNNNFDMSTPDNKLILKKGSNKTNQCINENKLPESPNSNNDDLNIYQTNSSNKKRMLKIIKKKNTAPSISKKGAKKSDGLTPSTDESAKRKGLFKTSIDGVDAMFTITNRSEEEQMAEVLKRKDSNNFKNSPFPCKECFRGFTNEKSYSRHMLRHSDECGMFSCKICKLRLKTSNKLVKHTLEAHRFEYRCKICFFTTPGRYRATLHYEWHKGKMYECPHCTESFKRYTTFVTHIRIKHPTDFVCQLCGFAFVSELGLMQHKNLQHKTSGEVPEDGPLCEPCNVRFVSEDAYNTHLNVSARHKNDSNNHGKCPNQPPPVYVKGTRRKKIIDDEDLTCEQCGMQMTDPRAYHHHFKKMHPDKNRTLNPTIKAPCMCDKCGKIFKCQADLKAHFYKHTNEKTFKCIHCDKTFMMKYQLNYHNMSLHKKIRYPCNICSKGFSSHGNRQRHMKVTHSDARPYKCDICSKTFKTNVDKKNHITYVHLKKPWPKRTRGRQGQKIQSNEGASETDIQTWLPGENKNGNDSDESM